MRRACGLQSRRVAHFNARRLAIAPFREPFVRKPIEDKSRSPSHSASLCRASDSLFRIAEIDLNGIACFRSDVVSGDALCLETARNRVLGLRPAH